MEQGRSHEPDHSSPTLWVRRGDYPPHLPPAPLLSHAVGEEGDYNPHLPPNPLLPTLRERKGGLSPSPSPQPPPPHAAGEEGGMSGAGAISQTRSPLSHAVGEEGGDEWSRGDLANQITPLLRCGRGGGIIPLTFPQPPSSPTLRERKGGMSGAGAISQTRSPLSHAAGEEGGLYPSPSPNPLLPTLGERKGG